VRTSPASATDSWPPPDPAVLAFGQAVLADSGRRLWFLWWASSIAGALIGIVGRAWQPLTLGVALILGCVLIIGVRLADHWLWPWQIAGVWLRRVQWLELKTWVGEPLTPSVVTAWLIAHPDAEPHVRYRLLLLLGRADEAERLIPEFPDMTAKDRLRRYAAQAEARWTAGASADLAQVRAATAELDGADRRRADAALAWFVGLVTLSEGGSLRRVPPPKTTGLRLPLAVWVRLWRYRFWPLTWFLGMFVVVYIGLSVAALLART
jgi:hypothetical protein